MSTILDKIAEIEAEMARTQKNKATSAHLGMLKVGHHFVRLVWCEELTVAFLRCAGLRK